MPHTRVHLLVRSPFGGHEEGHVITDPAEVKAILAGPQVGHVLPVPAEPQDGAVTEEPSTARNSRAGKA